MVVGHAVMVEMVVVQVVGWVAYVRWGRPAPRVMVVRGRLQGRGWGVMMRLTTHAMRGGLVKLLRTAQVLGRVSGRSGRFRGRRGGG